MGKNRTIYVETLTRVEGEGGLTIRLHNGQIKDLRLDIFEPPRFFEALLRGRGLEEAPDITARICGICPVAYQMSSVHALEAALGVEISPEIRRLRRLLYCGEWIESHALHIHMLHAPDFLGYDDAIRLARDFPDEVKRGLRLKKHGNELLEVLGGRAIHPINVAVGGFYRWPPREKLAALIPNFQWGLQAAIDVTRWVAGFKFPDFEQPYDFVSLVHPEEYPMCEGRIEASHGPSIDASQFDQHFREEQVPHSTALHSLRIDTGRPYLVGPLARINASFDKLAPTARRVADDLSFESTCRNPFKSIIARGLELIHAYEEALSLLQDYRPTGPARIAYNYREGEGSAGTEAPRGLLFHQYRVDSAGKLIKAQIVPPTSQNQAQIEQDLREYLPRIIRQTDEEVARDSERLVRSYDPCISCSTHYLKVKLERG
jgi:coenzyme F420-reducing hydrogenase alpha subunit